MATPASRVLTMLDLLQSGGTRTVAELAERLGVDERTVRRYAGHLIDLDIPVESVRGRCGGYRLAPGYRMTPLMLSEEEALEVMLGLLAARRTSSSTANETAIAKIRRALPDRLVVQLDTVAGAVVHTSGPQEGATPDAGILLTVADAVQNHRPLSLRYRSGKPRTLHPYGLVAHAARWYLVGLDVGSGEERIFRLDRIIDARAQAGKFRPPTDFDAAEHLLDHLAQAPYRHLVVVRMQATVGEVRAHLPASVATLEPSPDDASWLRIEIHAERLDWVPGVLARIDRPFVIEQPDELRALLRELANRLMAGIQDL